MIKKKSESKKKKIISNTNTNKNQKSSHSPQPHKLQFKFNSPLISGKCYKLNSFAQTPKSIKSATITPSSHKIRKSK
jgi:hypothetical protein